MILSDFHCHTTFVDGKHTPEEMVKSAIAKGMHTLGFSEHAYVAFDPSCSLSKEQTLTYREEMKRLKEKYDGQIQLLCGIEMDYYSEDDAEAYDYIIGSVHYLKVNGEVYSVDLSVEETLRCIDQAFHGDRYAYACCYFEHVLKLKKKWNPNIVGHFDLLTKFSEQGIPFDFHNNAYQQAAVDAVDGLKDCVFEVNTGAVSRGYRLEPYPAMPWLQEIKRQGASVILSSDSHHKDTLLYDFEKTFSMVQSLGFLGGGFTDQQGKYHKQF